MHGTDSTATMVASCGYCKRWGINHTQQKCHPGVMSSKSTYGDSTPMAQGVTAGSDAKVRMWSPDTDRSEMRKLGEIIWNELSSQNFKKCSPPEVQLGTWKSRVFTLKEYFQLYSGMACGYSGGHHRILRWLTWSSHMEPVVHGTPWHRAIMVWSSEW
jgi:hypothetical protein